MKEKKDFLFTLKMTKSFKEKMEAFSDKLGITNACLVTLRLMSISADIQAQTKRIKEEKKERYRIMAEPILVYGKSGSGKSRSLKNFAEDEIFFVNVVSKRLPFAKKFKYEAKTSDYETIKNQLKKMPCKVAVIDDAGYLMTNTFMQGHSNPKGGASTFDLFNTIGDQFWNLILFIKKVLPEDVRVYFMMHEISNDSGEVKVRTIGKLLDEKVCIEGMFTICLHCMTNGQKHYFKTQGGSNDIAKSPEDMFELEIDNDLKAVDNRIVEFYGFDEVKENG